MKIELLPHLYQAVIEGSMFGIVVFDRATEQCLFANQMAKELLGQLSPALRDLVPVSEKPPFKSFGLEILLHEGLYHDIVIQRAGGSSFIANLGVRSLDVDGNSTHLLMLQDVTLQKKLQREIIAKQTEIKAASEELLKQNRQLKELDMAKDRFIALTTHELRTPLAAMVSSAEILKMGLYDTPEQMNEFIGMIYEQGQHLQELVNDILDFAKIQAGKMDFYIERQSPFELAKNILRSFESMAETYKVKLSIDEPKIPIDCYFDELRLKQILSNIINNAIKYNRPGGIVRLYLEVVPTSGSGDHLQESGAPSVRIVVEDTGKGIAEDQSNKVFNEFETVGQVAQHHKGTGLGMPISRKLAVGMGGSLEFTSRVGVGSKFWVDLPTEKVLDPTLYRSRHEQLGQRAE